MLLLRLRLLAIVICPLHDLPVLDLIGEPCARILRNPLPVRDRALPMDLAARTRARRAGLLVFLELGVELVSGHGRFNAAHDERDLLDSVVDAAKPVHGLRGSRERAHVPVHDDVPVCVEIEDRVRSARVLVVVVDDVDGVGRGPAGSELAGLVEAACFRQELGRRDHAELAARVDDDHLRMFLRGPLQLLLLRGCEKGLLEKGHDAFRAVWRVVSANRLARGSPDVLLDERVPF